MNRAYTYDEIIDTIDHAHRFGNRPGSEITAAALAMLGQPQKAFPFVHIAGTNGKGSVCAFLDSMLRRKDLKVGLFTSPHLIDFEERIVVSGKQIPKEDVVRLGSFLLAQEFPYPLTYFDYCLMMAVLYFAEQQVDVAIIETGLGGTLDSTNALGKPLASVIAKIGFDHMAILGNTLSAIASEKAGIIKEGCPAFSEIQEPEAAEVLANYAQKKGALYYHVCSPETIQWVSGLNLQLPGVHQWENGALAAEVAWALYGEDAKENLLDTAALTRCDWIREGLERAAWPGRMELLSKEPFFMVDGAHNGHGVAALKASLQQMYPGEKFHFFMGVLADKDYESMVDQLLPLALDFHTITPESYRALQGQALADYIRSHGINAAALSSLEEIPAKLYRKGKNIAFGSLYYVGDLKKLYQTENS